MGLTPSHLVITNTNMQFCTDCSLHSAVISIEPILAIKQHQSGNKRGEHTFRLGSGVHHFTALCPDLLGQRSLPEEAPVAEASAS